MTIESIGRREQHISVPAPTTWPLVLALGLALLFAGLLTTASVTILGAILAVSGGVGWFRQVLPSEAHETVQVLEEPPAPATARAEIARLNIPLEPHRALLPLEIYPISAGIKGGLAGAVVMALLAMLYGVISGNGIWYPVNLLAAGFLPPSVSITTAQMAQFNFGVLLIATAIHLITSLLVGLLYGAMLPMLPRHPILLGGVVGPILWSALIYTFLDIVNPVLSQRIHWVWFVISQVGFGLVAGIVVSRQERVRTMRHLPFALRVGIEALGLPDERQGPEQQ